MTTTPFLTYGCLATLTADQLFLRSWAFLLTRLVCTVQELRLPPNTTRTHTLGVAPSS